MKLYRNVTFTVSMRLGSEDINEADLNRLVERMKANSKKSAYQAGVLYRSVVITTEVGQALPVL